MSKRKATLDLSYRAVPVRSKAGPPSLDRKGRSVDFVAATENPVPMWDWEHGVIDEVLLMRGVQVPDSGQMPLLDSHSRYSSHDVIGSARDLKVEGTELMARAVFSSVPSAEEIFTKIEEGHITDVSIGYRVHDATVVPEGEKAVIAGTTWEGPVKVVTHWSVKELSVVPIGADQAAKARAEGAHLCVSVRDQAEQGEEEEEGEAGPQDDAVARAKADFDFRVRLAEASGDRK